MVDFVSGENYCLTDLQEIVRILRSPEGCPWDKEQTHESVRSALLEEGLEAIDAIERSDDAALCEELGDVLLQVLFHTQIALERSAFTLDDVINGISRKLVYRHPHVFGDTQADSSEQVLKNWESLKQTEKHFSTRTEALEAVPVSFPALLRADKLVSRAAKAGYSQPAEPLGEDAVGRALMDIVRRARAGHAEPELALAGECKRFIREFEAWERAQAGTGQ